VSFRAVLFDLDGTLLDTLEDIAATMNAVFGRRGYRPFTLDECRLMVGEGMETLVRRAVRPDHLLRKPLSMSQLQSEIHELGRQRL